MPLERSVDVEAGVLIVSGVGDVRGSDFARQTRSELAAPPLPPPYHCLYDMRQASFVGDTASLKLLARQISEADWPAGQRIALVVIGAQEFGLSRMFATLADKGPIEYRLFEEIDEARGWLGMQPSGEVRRQGEERAL